MRELHGISARKFTSTAGEGGGGLEGRRIKIRQIFEQLRNSTIFGRDRDPARLPVCTHNGAWDAASKQCRLSFIFHMMFASLSPRQSIAGPSAASS